MNNNQVININKFKSTLSSMVDKSANALPEGVNGDRLRINAMMYITEDENLYKVACNQPVKVAQLVFNFIALGLDMLNKECYIIPFGKKLQVLRDYKGEVKLAKKYSIYPIREIYARVVYEQDKYYFDNENKFVHEFDPFKIDRGNKIGAFCTVIYENGVQQTEFVNIDEINKVKSVSQSAKNDSSPWKKWEDEMYKKTVIRKAMKNISLDFGNSELQKAYRDSDNDIDFNARQNSDDIIEQSDVFDVDESVKEEIEEVGFDEI